MKSRLEVMVAEVREAAAQNTRPKTTHQAFSAILSLWTDAYGELKQLAPDETSKAAKKFEADYVTLRSETASVLYQLQTQN
ncbi:hypothetical protein HY969_01180 [Candidatus Kaiserbacteria bacterium]|nr:hypothetical protein [Candidatus Kaiserbacteria bacterium]